MNTIGLSGFRLGEPEGAQGRLHVEVSGFRDLPQVKDATVPPAVHTGQVNAEVVMLALEAGRHPHVITRPCHDWEEVGRWAQLLTIRGFAPVRVNGVRFEVSGNVVKLPGRHNVVPLFGGGTQGPWADHGR